MVPKRGLEPRRPEALPPQDSVSTSFTTSAVWSEKFSGCLFGLRTLIRVRFLLTRLPQGEPIGFVEQRSWVHG